MKEIPFGTLVPGKRNAVFVAITALSAIYADYKDDTMSPEYKSRKWPMCLMTQRWDGHTGFIGGAVEGDESFRTAVLRELEEEAGISNLDTSMLDELCAHEGDEIVVHLYHVNLGERDVGTLRYILDGTTFATHCISEGCIFWAHLGDYGKGRGRGALLNSNALAFAVKEELEKVIARLDAPTTPAPGGEAGAGA